MTAKPLELPGMAPLVRVMAMPADANPNGDIFGGWLLVVRSKRLVPKHFVNRPTRSNRWWCDSANGWESSVGIASLAQMDLAGGSLAMQRARGRCATVAIDGMVFHQPVYVGDEVSCYGELIRTGRSSMTIRIEAWRRNLATGEVRKVTEAMFTYVALGDNRRPRALPPPP